MNDRSLDHAWRVQRALDHIEAVLAGRFEMRDAADQAAMSPWHFQRVFREIVGVSVKQYVRRRRLSLASVDLLYTGKAIFHIALDAGFESHEAFTRAFFAQFGVSPSSFRSRRQPAEFSAVQFPATGIPRRHTPEGGSGPMEVLHWWTSGGEARALGELKWLLEARGHRWKDLAVPGGGGQTAVGLLRARALAGRPPAVAHLSGLGIREWANAGMLAPMDEVAARGDWDALLPPAIRELMKFGGRYVAAPLGVHRMNCLWVNLDLFRQAGLRLPTTWTELFAAAETLRRAGIVPVALGEQPWQVSLLFDNLALGVGGAEFYRKAILELDPHVIRSHAMGQALAAFRRIKDYTDGHCAGRNWDAATRMVIDGKAAMQFMGDWARAEFKLANRVPGRDYLCLPVPGTAEAFEFVVDSFVTFNQRGSGPRSAQAAFCSLVMDVELQDSFSRQKGSVPARRDLAPTRPERDAFGYADDFATSIRHDSLIPCSAMAQPESTWLAFESALWGFWNDRLTLEETVRELARAASARPGTRAPEGRGYAAGGL